MHFGRLHGAPRRGVLGAGVVCQGLAGGRGGSEEGRGGEGREGVGGFGGKGRGLRTATDDGRGRRSGGENVNVDENRANQF